MTPALNSALDSSPQPSPFAQRRHVLICLAAAAALVSPRLKASPVRLHQAIAAFTGGRPIGSGRVRLDIPTLVENGNSVPVSVQVDSPMSETAHVRRIALFSEKNPQAQVAVFHLGPRNGRAQVGTRMRMADSQQIVALVEFSDGSFQEARVDVIVTLAACIES